MDDVIDLRQVSFVAVMIVALTVATAAQQPVQQPAPPQPAAPQPATPASPPIPGTVTCPAPPPPGKPIERAFNAPAGMLLLQVNASKVGEFDKFLAQVMDALAKSTDPTVQKQARGLKFFRASESVANSDVLYVVIADPAVPCVDYGFGPFLAPAIPDDAKLMEAWNLLKTSLRNGGSLLNLVPVTAAP